jgi:hypothetical protein
MNLGARLLIGVAALAFVSTVAEAADGCGRGMYYNGRRCVPQEGYGSPYQRDYGPRYQRDYGPPVDRGPQLQLDLGGLQDIQQLPAELHGSGWRV